jgi:hypothetical protein
MPRRAIASTTPPAIEAPTATRPDGATPARPAVVQVRLIGPPAALDVADASLTEKYGHLWQPGPRNQSRKNRAEDLMYGTLIVPIPDAPKTGPR